MVEPQGRSLRIAKRCSGTFASSAASATSALPGASVAYRTLALNFSTGPPFSTI
jgi:hypothetical protein